jgi:RHS repeat-associated protein
MRLFSKIIFFYFCFFSLVHAEINGPGWLAMPEIQAVLTEPGAAASQASLPSLNLAGPATGFIDADFATDEIKELARGLENDPLRIFNFVRNQIRYEHYYGCKKGAALTLLEKSGNDFDQSTLLVALLREAAVSNPAIGIVRYKYGMMTIPQVAVNQRDLAHWMGRNTLTLSATATSNGGWPTLSGADRTFFYSDDGITGRILMARVCVEAVIGGTSRIMDPSFKVHTEIVGIDINSISGYNQANLLTQAGGSSTSSQVSGMNPANLSTHLGTLATTLTNSLKIAPAAGNATIQQVIGGRQISPVESADYASTAYFTYSLELATWAEIPGDKASTIEIKAASGLTWTKPFAELRGRRLAITFGESTPRKAQIWLDDLMEMEETGSIPGTEIVLETSIYHPFVNTNTNANQTDAPSQLKYQRSATVAGNTFSGSYAILYAFNPGKDHVRQREEKLSSYRAAGIADTSREVRTEILNVMGLKWMLQTEMALYLIDRATDIVRLNHHRVGRAGQEKSFYLDVAMQNSYLQQQQGDITKNRKSFELGGYIGSALEHSMVEQTQNGVAVSTVDLITRALTGGGAVNRIVNGNQTTLQPAVTPQTVGSWVGTGYALVQRSANSAGGVRMIISGGLNGGFGTTQGIVQSINLAQNLFSNPSTIYITPLNQSINFGADPVDLGTGAFVLNRTDLQLGGGEPRGLAFARNYHSNARHQNDTKLGFGWSHHYHYRWSNRSDGEVAFGGGTPAEAAIALAATHAAIDVYDINDPKKWACAMLALGWAVDQVKDNAVSIQLGERNLQFLRQPNGNLIPPAGMKLSLTPAAGGYELTVRHGNTVIFDSNGRGTKIRDLHNKELNLAYNTDGTLNTVTDCYNRVLTLIYNSGKLTGVTDSTGRSVTFTQDGNGNLTSYTDPESTLGHPIIWSYDYTSDHRIEKLRDPYNRVITHNFYDSFNRVKEQRSLGDIARTWKFFYSGSATVEQNPQNGRRTLNYDGKSQLISEIDAESNKMSYGYDGQGHRTSTTTPKAETTSTLYDSDHNPTRITDPLLHQTQLFYDPQLRLQRIKDKRGNDTTFTYTAQHLLETVTDPLLHVTENHYRTDGLLEWTKDAENKKTTFEYDTWGQANKIIYFDTKFQTILNNARGDVLTSTDPENRTVTNTYNKRRQSLTTTLPTIPGEPTATTSIIYDDAGHLESTTDAKGNVTNHQFNVLGNHVTTTLPAIPVMGGGSLNNIITNTYDVRDWMETSYNSLNHTVTTGYDAAHRTKTTQDPLNRITELFYDTNSQITEIRDPLLRVSQQAWNARGEKDFTTDALTKITDLKYDLNGNLEDYINRRNKIYHNIYDIANRLESSATPTLKTTLSTYYNNNLIKTVKEPSLQTTTINYNGRNLIESKIDSVGTVTYGYDDSTLLKTVTEGAATISRTYDERGRLKTFTSADGDLIQYRYDANNNLTRLTYPPDAVHPTGKQVNYTYNARNLLETVTDWSSRVTTYQYDRIGRLTHIIRPNGTTCRIALDAASQLLSMKEAKSGKLFSYLNFQYDAAGQIKNRFYAPLVQAAWQQPTFAATYDDDNRLLTVNGNAITHDADGNMTFGPISRSVGVPPTSISLTYNSRNQLTNASGESYIYDAEGRRRSITDSTGTTRDVIDPSGKLLIRHGPNGLKTYYVYGLGLLYEANQANQTKTYHFDQVGSTIVRTNDAGNVIGRAAYSAYGLIMLKEGDLETPFLYNGQAGVITEKNGLLHMRARYYSPYLMRFLNADPIGFSGGSNWFAYADGNPISLNDPFGLCPCDGGGFMGYTSWSEYGNEAADSLGGVAIGLAEGLSGGVIGIDNGTVAQMNELQRTGYHIGLTTSVIGAFIAPKATAPPRGGNPAAMRPGLETRGYRPAPGERMIQGQVDAAVQQAGGNPTVQRGGQDLFRLRSDGHGSTGATATPQNVRNVTPDGRVFVGKGPDAPVSPQQISELYKAQTGNGTSIIRTRVGR